MNDFDAIKVEREAARGDLALVTTLAPALFRSALECVAAANDTTRAQERAIRDLLAGIR